MIHPHVQALSHLGLLSDTERDQAQQELGRGATLLSALAPFESRLWPHYASSRQMPYHPTHTSLQVLFADLIPRQLALTHQIIPHRTRGQALQVITYQPDAPDGPHPDFPGSLLRHALTPPSVWRRVFNLAYPTALAGPLSEEEARALVTLTPLGQPVSVTPEQHAEITALISGLRYIHLSRDPTDPDVQPLVSLPLKALTRAYPHHLEGSRLVVLMQNPHDQQALARLRAQTQRDIIPAITTDETIQALLDVERLQEHLTPAGGAGWP